MAHPRQAAVRNRLLKAMTPDDFERIQPHLQPVVLPVPQTLIEADAPVEHVYFMETGIASITAAGANGRIEVGMVGREGAIGVVPAVLGVDCAPYDHFIQVAGDGLSIDRQALCDAVDASLSLRRLLLRYVQAEIIQVRQTAYANASYNTEPRLARWLLMCHDRVDGDDLAVKHDFLSMMLGVQRSGVTLALQALEGAGRIRGRRGRVTVVDRDSLEAVADGSYGIPEAEYARLIEGA